MWKCGGLVATVDEDWVRKVSEPRHKIQAPNHFDSLSGLISWILRGLLTALLHLHHHHLRWSDYQKDASVLLISANHGLYES